MNNNNKNVLITAKAYNLLLTEYGFKDTDLLAKLPKSEIKINSPKTLRFIYVNGTTYMNLLKEYTEEELLKRQEGFIISPSTGKKIKLFGKAFMSLITNNNYILDDLLKLRIADKKDIIVNILDIDNINQLIKTTNNQLIIYVSAINKEEDNDCCYKAAGIFNNGVLTGYYQIIEHKVTTIDVTYTYDDR